MGREGMTGLPVVLGNDRSPNETSKRRFTTINAGFATQS
jgi:hypothetical protein